MANMRLLQSGFIAYPQADLGKSAAGEESYRTAVHFNTSVTLDKTNWYDLEVDELTDKMVNTPKIITNFEFRESILKKAMSLFGAPLSFSEWFSIQRFSPGVTYMHRRFLMETISYIYSRKERKMSLSTYRDVLFAGADVSAHTAADKSGEFNEIDGMIKDLKRVDNASFYQEWSKDPAGLQDMLLTLDVIFGLRHKRGV